MSELVLNMETIGSLDLGELCDFEDAVGQPVSEAFAEGKVSARAILTLAWLVQRRTDPGFTLEAARKLKLEDIGMSLNGDE